MVSRRVIGPGMAAFRRSVPMNRRKNLQYSSLERLLI